MVIPFSPDSSESCSESGVAESLAPVVQVKPARVAVLMCTYNGQRFLAEQLDSIERQNHHDWTMVVSDDGSIDSTTDILDSYRRRWGEEKLTILEGPKRGFAANFMSITGNKQIQADFFAWSDQDDIWYDDKLQSAVAWLQDIPEGIPALYCGRTELACERGLSIGYATLFSRPFGFSNALVQSVAGGNTMVFNQAARKLLQESSENYDIVSHDWWAYLLVTGVGGRFFYEERPLVLYRQHEANFVGANTSFKAYFVRICKVFQGRFSLWNEKNIAGLEAVEYLLTEENKAALRHFKMARSSGLIARLTGLRRSGVYRQTLLGNVGLLLATVLKGV